MQRNIYYILALLFVGTTSCEDKLSQVLPKDELAASEALTTVNDHEIALIGTYTGLVSSSYYGRNFVAYADHSSDNGFIPAGAGARLNDFYTMAINPTNTALATWSQIYDVIARANNVITSVRNLQDGTPERRNRILGEALFLRALGHHDLSRLFAHDYGFTDDASHDGIPYMLESAVGEPARDPINVVYQNLIADLDEAVTLLEDNSRTGADAPNFASVWAAKALRARVKLYMSDFEGAQVDAEDVINNGPYTLTDYIVRDDEMNIQPDQIDSWSSREPTSESIFEVEVDQIDDLYPGRNGLSGIYVRAEGFGDAGPNLDIINLYDAADIRQNWYVNINGVWFVNKYPGQGGNVLFFTTPVLRLTEMILIQAETLARANENSAARDAINLITGRSNAPEISSSGAQLLTDILTERRKELAFEGHRYYDLKRLQQDIVRNDCNLIQNCVIPYGDKLFAYPIPIEERLANRNMRQNPGY